jgi:hypothetical protein
VSAPQVGADVAVGNTTLELGLDVDVELDDGNNGHGNDTGHSDSSNPGRGKGSETPLVDVGGLLDGLARRSGRK